MLTRKLILVILVFAIWGAASAARAQDSSQSPPFRPFGGFFHSMFNPNDQDDRKPAPSGEPVYTDEQGRPIPAPTLTPTPGPPREGSIRPVPPAPVATPEIPEQPPTGFAMQNTASTTYSSGQTPTPAHRASGDNYSFQWDNNSANPPAVPSPPPAGVANGSPPPDAKAATGPELSGQPLHERLQNFRHSAFGDDQVLTAPPADAATAPPALRQADRSAAPGVPSASGGLPTPAPRPLAGDPLTPEPRLPALEPKLTAEPSPAGPATEPGVLFTRNSPNLSVETTGPRRIIVGKEASYDVVLQNSSEVAADGVTVFVALPDWADVVGSNASSGEAKPAPQGRNEPFQWVVGHVEARAREKLVLRIVPRQSRAFELAVRCDYKPASSQATIEVQEPKLVMTLDGPREVFFNKREVYKLKLQNAGSGPADNVTLTLMPVATGDAQGVTHKLGTLAAGEQRTIEVELTARQAGNLLIRMEAKGDGSAQASLSERVVVHRAGLKVEMEAPALQYVGAPAAYRIHVRNPGDALAQNVRLAIELPLGVKFVSGTENPRVGADGNKVQWVFEKIDPGSEQVAVLRCVLALGGAARFVARASTDDLSATAEGLTQVEAVADLRLDVQDPEGPVPVNQETTYTLSLRNRGTKAAENVEVVAYFSNGIEPTSAEGHPHQLSPGQILFSPIPSVAPGGEVVLKVTARAEKPGNHVFRAEVHCKSLGTRLVREETTRFYQDGLPASEREAVRTADRRPPLRSTAEPPALASPPQSPPGGEPPPLPAPPQ